MEIIRPFGPTVSLTKIPEDIIKKLNDYVDEVILDSKKQIELDYGSKLAGNVKQEFLLSKEFCISSGWEKFLMQNAYEWIFKSSNKKISKFEIIDSWIVRQFENDYNPLHSHGGHISGVGYLKLPNNYGKSEQESKGENLNGKLQLIHGTQQFLSPIVLTITPKVGDFYYFPNYMQHMVYPFKNKTEERRSVSFNAKIDDNIYNVHGKY